MVEIEGAFLKFGHNKIVPMSHEYKKILWKQVEVHFVLPIPIKYRMYLQFFASLKSYSKLLLFKIDSHLKVLIL